MSGIEGPGGGGGLSLSSSMCVPPRRAGYRRRLAQRIQVVSISILSRRLSSNTPRACASPSPTLQGECVCTCGCCHPYTCLIVFETVAKWLEVKKSNKPNKRGNWFHFKNYNAWNIRIWRNRSHHITGSNPNRFAVSKTALWSTLPCHHPATHLCTKCCIRPTQSNPFVSNSNSEPVRSIEDDLYKFTCCFW
jgi:hypothetical protein